MAGVLAGICSLADRQGGFFNGLLPSHGHQKRAIIVKVAPTETFFARGGDERSRCQGFARLPCPLHRLQNQGDIGQVNEDQNDSASAVDESASRRPCQSKRYKTSRQCGEDFLPFHGYG